ncbi:glycoside hydrolase family 43 protein [Flavilitoribacter nigricans]|uniref:Glycoside hydrolase n=1 Tax=Flavilitoribacter nigricans (strain ATCC 23147 / DSM 23189 / NBRC 102662 / NCIMB 1420 / SS-2) TaxID=1122177 RepID=A0A2D0N4E5_FLAN2|nr:glycoside hydrolase family 43 protein [Flavilitoribacter nigricans]PHN03374.1 glycoside hydrolase [Flavilitoribacter nigricans DSM 23189 = NBRC 102662]
MRYPFLFLPSALLFLSACGDPGIESGTGTAVGTYTNPVGDSIRMGDPYVLLHEGTYYLYGTAGKDGFKCWSSGNLRDWTYEGYAFKETTTSFGQSNYWAPEVIHYRDKFYLTYSCKPKDTGAYPDMMLVCLAESDSPTGPFTDKYAPWIDQGYSCIDAHIFVDEEQPYVYFDRVGYVGDWPDGYMFGIIYAMQLDRDNLQPSGDTVRVSEAEQDWENPDSDFSRCNEGAYVFKERDTYYLTYSANHWADPDYGIGYATAPTPMGPWTKAPDNPLIGKDSLRGIFGPGHNSFTSSPDGKETFMVYHTHGSFEDKERTVNIDRIKIDDAGALRILGPTRTPQPLPSGIR